MSGDVQPRKRKDKSKKRKDEDEPVSIREKRSSSEHSPDIQMHIEKESETGGHWCAKVVFFLLLSILVGLIALIIVENRGMTEVAQPQGESRFSEYFEGWTEEPKEHDDHDDHVVESLHDEEDDHDNDDHDDNDSTTVYEEENISQQDDDEEEQAAPVSQEADDENDDDNEEDTNSQEQVTQKEEEKDDQSQEKETPEDNDDDNDDNDDNVSEPEELTLDDGDLPFEEDTAADSTEQFFDNDAGEELYVKRMSEEKLAKSKEAEAKSNEEQETGGGLSSETFDNNFDLFEEELKEANDHIEKNPKKALKIFEKLLKYQPKLQAALVGKASALNKLSDVYKDNSLLREAVQIYERLLLDKNMMIQDTELFEEIGVICVDRMTFLGNYNRAIEVQKVLVERFPANVDHRNQLAIIYLMSSRLSDAKHILHETLLKWRHNGVALVHYGFILKQLDNDLEHAVIFLKEGIESGENGTQEGLFYINLGDALMRLGRSLEAQEIYGEGASRGLFLSSQQRSLYNINRLEGRPFWSVEDTTYAKQLRQLQQHYSKILQEGQYALDLAINGYINESENLRDRGDWKQYEIFARGRRNIENCKNTPVTCDLIESFTAASGCKRGQVKYSVMLPQTHVWPHTGPTNCRLRAHLGLQIPPETFIRVANETRSWKEKEWLIFDDSFEHEVWHNGTTRRLVLIVDVWHPELTEDERKSLTAI